MDAKQRTALLAGLVLTLILPAALLALRESVPLGESKVVFALTKSWGIAIAVLALVHFWERQSFGSIGLHQPSWKDLGWGVGGFVAGVLAFGALTPLVQALNLGTVNEGIQKLTQLPLHTRVIFVITAGITEEIIFRGYPIERLIQWTGKPWLSAAIAYVVFVGLHAPFWGPGGALQIGAWSLVVTFVYMRRRSLAPCILMHTLNDAFAFIVVPMFFLAAAPA